MAMTGNMLLSRALVREGAQTLFYLMGTPILDASKACGTEGIQMIDVRHEQAAAMMAHAYARVLARPGVCLSSSGPGTVNLSTGLANALIDAAPVVALGGSSPVSDFGTGAFQEIDQLAVMRPVTKWAERVYEAHRIPEYVHQAFAAAISGKPGPVYLDLPGDVLYQTVEEAAVVWPDTVQACNLYRPAASSDALDRLLTLLRHAQRPIVVAGSGALWSQAAGELHCFVNATGIPLFTTPPARGLLPEDDAHCFPGARSKAFAEADLVLIIGSRLNYVLGFGQTSRFAAGAKLVRIDIDPGELGRGNLDLGIIGDAKTVLRQVCDRLPMYFSTANYAKWRAELAAADATHREAQCAMAGQQSEPIHPLRLCLAVSEVLPRNAIVVADGQEILHYSRQSMRSFAPGHRLTPGPFGTMGVGVPFALGAKAAAPGAPVVVMQGDGSFGLNAMELDTAVRHKLPVLVVISLNGGWTADAGDARIGRELACTRYDRVAEALGCHGEFVTRAEDLRPALDRALLAMQRGQPAVVNVVTDARARAKTARYARFET